MSKIKSIHPLEILDSRGNPTVQATVTLADSTQATAAVPSGASKGTHEAVELRDGDARRYGGQGVQQAIAHIRQTITPALIGKDPTQQADIDTTMLALDGTENKGKLGANAILAVSLAVCRAAAQSQHTPLYQHIAGLAGTTMRAGRVAVIPMLNVLNGGLHAGGNIDFQEFMLVPSPDIRYPDALRLGSEIYHVLQKTLKDQHVNTAVGDEGGFAPALESNHRALELLRQAISSSGYTYGQDVSVALDLASSNFYREGRYRIKDRPDGMTTDQCVDYLYDLQKEFQLLSLEDPLSEDDWEGWTALTKRLCHSEPVCVGRRSEESRPASSAQRDPSSDGNRTQDDGTQIVGDDLLVTNPKRLQKAIERKACNSILVKVNQIGTLTETLQVIAMAKTAGFSIIISHRSGETPDDFIADLAVGVAAQYVKFGAPARGERVAKYNRLLCIDDYLKNSR